MATLNCTLNGINNFTSANSAGIWGYSSWQSATTVINNKPCFGKFYYGGKYKYRALVLKITTPTYPDDSHSRKLSISVGLRRSTAGSDNWHCAISTTAPSFSTTTSAQIPSTWITTWNSVSTSAAWTTKTFGTSNFNFKSNTTYYLWLYSDTPTGNNTTGFFGNNYGSAPQISVTTSYSTAISNGTYAKPTNPSLYGINGYYSGGKIEIDINTSYPNCYVGTSATGTFWKKTLYAASDGKKYFTVDADTTSTSKTYYIVMAASSVTAFSISAPPTAYQISYSCPRYACQIYCHSQEPLVFYNVNSPTAACSEFDGMTAKGLCKTETGTSVDLSFDWANNGATLNGGTFYRIYTGNKTSTYYCGGSTAHTAITSITFYGKDSILTGATTDEDGNILDSAMTDCETDNSYSLIGWTEDTSNYTPEYSTLADAMVDGSTIYGVYQYDDSITITMYALTDDGECYRHSLQDTYARYYYGMGNYYVAFYETFGNEPSVTPDNWKLVGWKYVDNDTIYSWRNLVDTSSTAQLSDIEIVIEPDNHVYFGNSSWKNVKAYYGVNGVWKPIVVRRGVNGTWK